MSLPVIQPSSLDFLRKLSKHNNREWFNDHKTLYSAAHENMIAFAEALLLEMNKHDHIETLSGKKSLFRIYRDVRFQKRRRLIIHTWTAVLKEQLNNCVAVTIII